MKIITEYTLTLPKISSLFIYAIYLFLTINLFQLNVKKYKFFHFMEIKTFHFVNDFAI